MGITVSVALLYTVVILGIAYYGYRASGEGMEDYVLAGRKVTWHTLGWTLIATNFTSWTMIGLPAFYYDHGAAFWTLILVWSTFHMLISWHYSQRFWVAGKIHGHITPADIFGDYYQSETFRVLISVVSIIMLFVTLVTQYIGLGVSLQSLLMQKITYSNAVILSMVLTMIYVFFGGLRSVALTDVFQGIVMSVVLVIGAIVSIQILPDIGFSNIFQKVGDSMITSPGPFAALGMSGFIMWFLVQSLAMANMPYHTQRYMMGLNLQEYRKAHYLYIPCFWWLITPGLFIGFAVKLAMPGLAGTAIEDAVIKFISQASPVIGAFYSVGMVAGIMSSSDSTLLTISSFVTRDIYEKTFLRGQTVSDRRATWIARGVVVVLSILSYWGAIARPAGILIISLIPFAAFALFMFPFIGVLFWRRIGKLAGIGSFVVGFVVNIIFNYFVTPPFFNGHLLGILAGGLALVVLAQFGQPMPQEVQDRYHGVFDRVFGRVNA